MTDRAALRAALAAVAAAHALLAAELAAPVAAPDDPLLDLQEIAERYAVGRRAVVGAIRRGDLAAAEGPRRRILVRASEVRRWLESRPVRPGLRAVDDVDTDPLERALASGDLEVSR